MAAYQSGLRSRLFTALLTGMLSSCALLPQPEINPVTASCSLSPQVEEKPATGATLFRISDALLTLKTYRSGWLQGLAHNHVMTTNQVNGVIGLAPPPATSSAALCFRPFDLTLDDAQARLDAGEGFESIRTAKDIEATRSRMLGPKGFDSNQHPQVEVRIRLADTLVPEPGKQNVVLSIGLRGQWFEKVVPLRWRLSEDRLAAEADFQISQQALGIRPYSAFAGAIAVDDVVQVTMTFTATREY